MSKYFKLFILRRKSIENEFFFEKSKTLYNQDLKSDKLETSIFFLPSLSSLLPFLFLSPSLLPSSFSPFFFFLSLFSLFFPLARRSSTQTRGYPTAWAPRRASNHSRDLRRMAPEAAQPDQLAPAQARSGPAQANQPETPLFQLVHKLSSSR